MKSLLRILVGLLGLFNIAMGLLFLLDPVRMSATFALSPVGIEGLSSIRADMPAFFLVAGLFALLGAWQSNPEPLKVPILLLGIAFLGRALSLMLDGITPTSFQPMLAEATMVLLLLAARRAFARR